MIPEHTDAALASLDPDLVARLRFVLEADALKSVLRRNSITDGSRRENTGEHSAKISLRAVGVLAPHSRGSRSTSVECHQGCYPCLTSWKIDAGETFVYRRGLRTHKRSWSSVPPIVYSRWCQRGRREVADGGTSSRRAPPGAQRPLVDRLAPLLLNHANRGRGWQASAGSRQSELVAYNAHIADGSDPPPGPQPPRLLDDATAQGLASHRGPDRSKPDQSSPTNQARPIKKRSRASRRAAGGSARPGCCRDP